MEHSMAIFEIIRSPVIGCEREFNTTLASLGYGYDITTDVIRRMMEEQAKGVFGWRPFNTGIVFEVEIDFASWEVRFVAPDMAFGAETALRYVNAMQQVALIAFTLQSYLKNMRE